MDHEEQSDIDVSVGPTEPVEFPWVLLETGRLYTFTYVGRNKEPKTKVIRFQRTVVGVHEDFTKVQAFFQGLDLVARLDRSYAVNMIDLTTFKEVEQWELPKLLHQAEISNRES